ncbi:MAG: TlpA disulfide reductase family protein [Acidobacteriota bacterium]
MRRLMILAVVGCVVIPSFLWGGEHTPVPNVELRSLDGKNSVRIEDFQGHPVLVTFWASWCGPCRTELPELAELTRELKDSGLVLLTINVDSSAAAGQRFLKRAGIDVSAYRLNDRDQALIGVRSLPTTVLLDGDAVPVQVFRGYSPTVVGAIRRLVEGMGATTPAPGREPR